MTEYKKGQRVKVEYEGVISGWTTDRIHVIPDSAVNRVACTVPVESVTLLDPPDWPPQVGDIWEAEGCEWFAAEGWGIIGLIPAHDGLPKDLGPFKALNPVLVRRRGQ